jgi:acyl-CoA hydrolase
VDNFTIVRPEHLNHHGDLFGGTMLRWIDEFS